MDAATNAAVRGDGPRPRVMLVAMDAIPPAPTGSGNRAIRWGLFHGLVEAGVDVGYYSASDSSRFETEFKQFESSLRAGHDRLWRDQAQTGVAARDALRQALDEFDPQVAIAYGTEPLVLVRRVATDALVGITSVDLEFLPGLYRLAHDVRFGTPRDKLRSLARSPRTLLRAFSSYRDVRSTYRSADFVLNHAAHHAAWHARAHGRPTLYTPNPLSDVTVPERRTATPPRFVLLGGVGGIATQTGLTWFAERVYPLIETEIKNGRFEVHLIGRGELSGAIDQRLRAIVRRGYVEDLGPEFAAATAVLVPTPIDLGFRTRILDAFRHGTAVIAHSANAAGMPELEHGANAVLASTPSDFAAGMISLSSVESEARRLGTNARIAFETSLNGELQARRLMSFIEKLREAKLPQSR